MQSPRYQKGVRTPLVVASICLVFTPFAGASERFTQRFGTDRVNTRIMRFIGPAKSGAVTETERGLVIHLPVEKQVATHVTDEKQGESQDAVEKQLVTQAGIATRFMVSGDFEITVRYELVDVPKPKKGYGAGIVLRLSRPEPTQTQVGFGRRKRIDGKDLFNANVASSDTGKPKSKQKFLPAKAESGSLRLVRTGATLHFLVADGVDEEFREMRQVEFDKEPVHSLLVLGDTGNSDTSLTIHLKEISIEADSLPSGVGVPAARRNIFWSTSAALGVAGVLVLVGCGVWYWRR